MAEINSILINSCHSGQVLSNQVESSPLLSAPQPSCWSLLASRYHRTRKCVSSKAALLILLWSFIVGLVCGYTLIPDILVQEFPGSYVYSSSAYAVFAALYLLFPLAGCLADIKCGRFKVIFASTIVSLISAVLLLGGTLILVIKFRTHYDMTPPYSIVVFAFIGLLILGLCLGLTGFAANVIQFGMDQLYDSPGEDRSLFIHWYVWLYFTGIAIVQTQLNLHDEVWKKLYYGIRLHLNQNEMYFEVLQFIPETFCLTLALSLVLCLVRYKRRWFLIVPGRTNPYQLVYRVTKFAYQHKTPVRRSAFTYCEDELPTGLDLGKEKYGGCFTTEEVEDVKAFYGILRVLVSFGAVFFLDFAASFSLPWQLQLNDMSVNSGLIGSLFVVFSIPFHLFLIRPLFHHYIPGMLKRMGFALILSLLSLVTAFSTDVAMQLEYKFNGTSTNLCMLVDIEQPSQITAALFVQLTLSAVSNILIYVATFEFICSQSPHAMKGMLIGLLYAIKGVYQVLGTLAAMPFTVFSEFLYPHCGLYYSISTMSIGLVALLVYVCVARRYQYRERDEPSRIRQYAEEYYSNS